MSELRDKIVETTKRLERLSQTELELGLSEKKLASVRAEFEKLRADSSALIKERDNATLREARADEQKRYEDLKRNLAEESAKRDEIAVSFGGVIPTFEQIDDAAYKHNEAKRLMENGAGDGSSEYRDLAAYFSVVENVDEIDGARRALDRVRSADARQKEEAALASEKFSRRIPEVCEIDEMITLLSQKRRISIGIPCGIVIVLAAVLLGVLVSPYLYLLGATGLPLLLIGVFRNRRLRNEYARRLSDFFASVTDAPISDKASATALLYEMRTLSERLSSSLDTQGEDISILSCFAAKFGIVGDTLSGVESVLKKHERYVTLSVAEQYIQGERDAQRERAVRLMGEANAFLSHYNISRTEPFSELRRMLTEYNRLSEEIVSKQREINNYENRRFLSDDIAVSTRTAKEIDMVRKEMDERSSVLGRECALLERQCRAYADELEGRDEIIATLGALEEKYAKYKDNYEVILLTKKYLTDAKDSMTAKYLGKTKCGFEKYAQLIGNEVGEFEMDTSFGVSKLEGAGRKPTEAYSKGSRDLYDLSARLALTDALYDGELPFLVLDDPFSSFDDGKTAAALTLLSEFAKERQIIYFTCSKSRAI